MKTLLKILFGSVAVVVLILMIAGLVALVAFDSEDYQEAITDLVSAQTGRSFEIDEAPSLDIIPCCSIRLTGMRLGSPPEFGDQEFIRIHSAAAGIRLWPLIRRGEVQIDRIHLDGVQVNLERRSDQSINWAFDVPTTGPESTDEAPDSSVSLSDLSIAGITVENAGVSWKDTDAEYSIENLSLETGSIVAGQPFDLSAGLDVIDATTKDQVSMTLNTKVQFDKEGTGLDLNNVQLNTIISTPGADVPDLTATISAGAIATNWQSQHTQLKEMKATFESAGVKLLVSGGGELLNQQLVFSGKLEIPTFSPRAVITTLGEAAPVTEDPTVLTEFAASADWAVTGDTANISSLVLDLDQTRITGEFTVKNFELPRYQFKLLADQLNLDRYLSPQTENNNSDVKSSQDSDLDLPTDFLRQLRMNGTLRMERLIANSIQMNDARVKISATKGKINLDPIRAQLYQGQYVGRMGLDVTGDVARLNLRQEITAVQATPLLTDLLATSNLGGLLTARIEAKARGNSERALRKSLSGTLAFSLADGVYQGMDIWHEIRTRRAQIKGDPPPEGVDNQQTEITELEITGRMAQGILTSERFNMEIPFIRLTGGGTANLVDQNLDFQLKARVFEQPRFSDGENLTDLMGVGIPISISGNAEDPDIRVDLGEAVKQWAINKLSERLLDRLIPDKKEPAPTGENNAQEKESNPRDDLKNALKDLLDL